ncbi:MAG: hypothetical protein ACFFAO_05320 [Candidatus Hermodarchaeota archaeon]
MVANSRPLIMYIVAFIASLILFILAIISFVARIGGVFRGVIDLGFCILILLLILGDKKVYIPNLERILLLFGITIIILVFLILGIFEIIAGILLILSSLIGFLLGGQN